MGPKVPNHPLHLNISLDLNLRPLRMRRVRRLPARLLLLRLTSVDVHSPWVLTNLPSISQ